MYGLVIYLTSLTCDGPWIQLDLDPAQPLAKPLGQVFGPEAAAKVRQQCWDKYVPAMLML
jgi:hypothetical protein